MLQGANLVLEGYIDADMVENLNNKKSTLDFLYTFVGEIAS